MADFLQFNVSSQEDGQQNYILSSNLFLEQKLKNITLTGLLNSEFLILFIHCIYTPVSYNMHMYHYSYNTKVSNLNTTFIKEVVLG